MKIERQRLIHDVFGEAEIASARDNTLRRGGRVLRRRRLVRRARSIAWVIAAFLLPILAVRNASIPRQVRVAKVGEPARTGTTAKIAILSDDELMALFPNTPVALAEIHGKKRLLFLRPGDEARFLASGRVR